MIRIICLLLIAALLSPRVVHAQTDTARSSVTTQAGAIFAHIQYGDTIAFEVIRRDADLLRGTYVAAGQPRVAWDQGLTNGAAPSGLTIGFFYPDAPAEARPLVEMDFARRNDSMVVITRGADSTHSDTRPSRRGAMPVVSRSMIHLAFLAYYAAQERLTVLPLYLTNSGKTFDAAVSVRGEEVTVTVDGLTVHAVWEDGMLIEMRVPSQELVVKRVGALP